MRYTLFTLSCLLTTLYALTITSPAKGSALDPSKDITITWTSTSSDPATINLFFVQVGNNNQVANNVATSSGTFTVPANTILSYGAGYTVVARSTAGDQLATSGNFILAYGATVTTKNNGQLSLVATTGAPASAVASTSNDNPFAPGATTTDNPFASPDATTTATGTDSTMTSPPFTTHGPESLTTTLSETGSQTIIGGATSTTASTSSTATHNAQVRLTAGKEVMGVAGLLAGLFALVA